MQDSPQAQILTLSSYQEQAATTAIYPHNKHVAVKIIGILSLLELMGEIAEHAKKILRDNGGYYDGERTLRITELLHQIIKEANVILQPAVWWNTTSNEQETINTNEFPGALYTLLGLFGEAGETTHKILDNIRVFNAIDQDVSWDETELNKELGDILWYTSQLCRELGANMTDVAQANLDKLSSRKERGKLQGDGDNR